MKRAYAVSHLYDESGSAKARYDEFLHAADRRRLVDELRSSGQGLHHRVLAGLGDVLAVLLSPATCRWGLRQSPYLHNC
jgi:hypothetical protein